MTEPEKKPTPAGWKLWHAAAVYCTRVQTQGLVRTLLHTADVHIGRLLTWPILWILTFTWKGMLVFYWRISPKVPAEVYAKRQCICEGCPHVEIDGNDRYCGKCTCPHTRWSELSTKNQREDHNCPMGLHPGSVLVDMERPLEREPGKPSGCKGCGGNGRPHGNDVVRVAVTDSKTW